jgi:hypothetical protein
MDAIPLSPNYLLASLPSGDFELLRPHLKTVEFVQEAVLIAAGEPLTRIFFALSGVISLVVTLASGDAVEVAMIGRDSVFGSNSVSLVAHQLQNAGIIKYSRGHIEITNLSGLKDVSCECYKTVNVQHDRLLNEG